MAELKSQISELTNELSEASTNINKMKDDTVSMEMKMAELEEQREGIMTGLLHLCQSNIMIGDLFNFKIQG